MALASLSLPGKWRSFRKSLARNRKGVAMAHGLPLPGGRVEGDHDLCPSPPHYYHYYYHYFYHYLDHDSLSLSLSLPLSLSVSLHSSKKRGGMGMVTSLPSF